MPIEDPPIEQRPGRATPAPEPSRAPGNVHADGAVIVGGITRMRAATLLKKADRTVAVVDTR